MKTSLAQSAGRTLYLFLVIALLANCDPCSDNDRSENLTDAGLEFELRDGKTGNSLFLNTGYVADSVKLLNTTVKLRKFTSDNQKYTFRIDSIYNSTQDKIGVHVDKTFYLYLNKSDTDTIRLSYLPTTGRCDPYFTDYQVFYNQHSIASSKNTITFSTLINKL